jgi:hypothetical protein
MTSNHSDSTHHVSLKRRKCKFRTLGWGGIAGICLIFYLSTGCSKSSREKLDASQNRTFAELLSAKGTVLLLKAGQANWQEVPIGAPLMNGDLIQTGISGNAVIRYPNGTTASIQAQTIFAVQRTGNNEMEILMPVEMPARGAQSSGNSNESLTGNQASKGSLFERAKAGQLRPSLNLRRIVPFGRSLELIGQVEPGSSLTVNDETVEVGGDGSFKHFTNPFPKSAARVYLVMKATNLAGRDSILTTTHDFGSQGGSN